MGTPLRVLLIEDNEDDAALVVRTLEREGYELIWKRVDTPEATHKALDEERWDLVLSDHTMPRFSAPDALALLEARGEQMPLIIVSGSIGEEAAVESMRAGARDYVMKEKLVKLPAAVARELRDAQARRAHVESEENLREARERLDSAMQQLA